MKINLIEYFEETVNNNPLKTAIVDGLDKINFVTLKARAENLSIVLNSKYNTRNTPYAVFLPKSINSILTNLAITYSGNIYMNLDVKSPQQRLLNILGLILPTVLITDSVHMKLLPPELPCEIFNLDTIDLERVEKSGYSRNGFLDLIDTDPYCIINTSGSTGTPKGVVLNHRSFIDFTEWARLELKIKEDEIIGSLSPLVFDIYSYELCMLMCYSSSIVILPEHFAAFPIRILEILEKELVSYIFWVPTIMVNIANMNLLKDVQLSSLRTVWFAGEVFPTKQFNYWHRNLPNTTFVNLYGPIEITLDCTYFVVDREMDDEEVLPIGFPCRNTDVLILNDSNVECQNGEIGELCVRGSSLAMGYYNNPEKTSHAFVQNPLNKSYPELIYRTGDLVFRRENGEIIFKGRKDSLIKHLGYRIELGEIEHVIVNSLKIVKNACVVYNYSKKEITMFYEAENDISASDFRKAIISMLPKYMVPVVFHRMESLPRNTNGKIDRLLLKEKVNE